MKIFARQFLGRNHSWGVVGRNIARALLRQGHDVHLFSTDGISKIGDDLKPCLIGYGEKDKGRPKIFRKNHAHYDMQFSYTAMQNFRSYLNMGMKNRFGIYNYDGTVLPPGWARLYRHTDKLLPSSNFAKDIFERNKVPEKHMIVVPHGITLSDFEIAEEDIYQLKTKKSIKILNVCGQVHRRKNLPGMLDAYNKAFTKDDDVCLVLKVVNKRPEQKFEISFRDTFNKWKESNPDHPEVEVIYDYIPKIETLFAACDIHFSLSNIECFHIPSLQSMASGMITIQSRWGGNMDFMHDKNSLLVDGKVVRCPQNYQYWVSSPYAEMFEPNLDDAVDKLKYAVENFDKIKKEFEPEMKKTTNKFTWDNVAKQMVEICR